MVEYRDMLRTCMFWYHTSMFVYYNPDCRYTVKRIADRLHAAARSGKSDSSIDFGCDEIECFDVVVLEDDFTFEPSV